MNIEKIYTQNYYNLKRNVEEDNFIAELNKTRAVTLVSPILKVFADKLYLQITGRSKIKSALPEIIINEAEINKQLNVLLSKNSLYKHIDDPNITSRFFTNAIRKLDKRIFEKNGTNDEKHFLQSYIFYWLENNFAKTIAKDNRFKSYESIRKIINQTEILHHFYNSFKNAIPNKWIKDAKVNWTKVIQDPKNVLESIRTFDKDYFNGYLLQLDKYQDYSPWKFIFESTRFSDHAMFSDEYSFKNIVLLKRNISLWIEFWDALKWPILQDIPFLYNEHPNDILRVAKHLVKKKNRLNSNPKHLAFLLLKNFFDNALKVQENLSFYANSERISSLSTYERNEEILKKGFELSTSWAKEKIVLYKEIIEILLKIVSVDEMSEWIFSYTPRSSVRNEYDTTYNAEVEVLLSAFNPHISKEPFEEQIQNAGRNFNLRKFEFLSTQISDETKKEHLITLLNTLTDFIQTDRFYWDGTFSTAYWSALKSIGQLLSYDNDPIAKSKELIDKFKVIHEGWNIAPSNYKLTQIESFIYCGVILLLEHDKAFKNQEERNTYFNYVLDLVVSQTRFMVGKIKNDYTLPLYLLSLVANQMYSDLKESYETTIINDIDDINTVVAILSNDSYKLCPVSSDMLKSRLDTEFNLQKRQFMQRGQSTEIEKLEDGIKKLDISLS